MALRPPSRSVGIRFIVVCAILLAFVHLHLYEGEGRVYQSTWGWRTETDRGQNPSPYNGTIEEGCEGLTGFDRIVITVKTGATEASKKIPTQLRTSLRCAPYVYIFSDMAQSIGETQVYDSLDDIAPSIVDVNKDFDIYRKQKELRDPEKIMAELSDMRDSRIKDDLAAWTLDKYKNMHIVEKIGALKPEMDWYMHIDADTYVMWPSLIRWIQRLDPSKKSYMGSLALINDLPFGHGGSGYLMSREAMRTFAVTNNGTAAKWDSKMHEECCGDWVLAQVLKEYKMDLKNSWPTINGETQSTIPFAEDHWCQPLVTLHHISSPEAEQLGSFEAKRKDKSSPVTYEELFKDLVSDLIPDELANWDNLSKDGTVANIATAEACVHACQANHKCLQSRYDGAECSIGTKHFSLGKKHEMKDGLQWSSSWNKTRIAEWVRKQKPCGKLKFPHQERPSKWLDGRP
ncbi:hypothetical protein ONS95_001886 [Cadophora gregata]|uniref:uncharacterized protein n=1 Tax=Cadophora gregata TaxID=51156 RepID=UPI0026DCBF1F|nr:uncharacterized protein ONS95_001886 [Cadophora gregata]KAK0111532.1 hypothetical protein ONS95_001886 [Cadophora gregata]KAK0111992.1 hypothetical protein ONS96_001254 [Cadophora gregata f. sp. sojae]